MAQAAAIRAHAPGHVLGGLDLELACFLHRHPAATAIDFIHDAALTGDNHTRVTMHRLINEGLAAQVGVDRSRIHKGRYIKTYGLTEAGEAALRTTAQYYRAQLTMIEHALTR